MKTIYLAGGCFWGMQKYFDQFDGVICTEVGYANGPDKAPTYEEVCADSGLLYSVYSLLGKGLKLNFSGPQDFLAYRAILFWLLTRAL